MKFFQYSKGRQEATAALTKFLIASGKSWDIYLLFIPAVTVIHPHFDPVEGKKHFRFNLTLKGFWWFWRVTTKGKFIKNQSFLSSHLFRPDVEEHAATVFNKTTILSIGWVRKV